MLRDELDCPRGFADDRVVVLDPCCGTGAYLLEVLRCVAEQLQDEGAGAALASKLLDAFCRRILGFEILTAPFVVAQLQLYLILSELGVEPDESHRPAIFLTNALTGWDGPEQLKLQFPELQQEHDAAQKVKREAKIIIVLGNPPYNRFAGAPVDEEQDLADHYKGIRRDEKGRQVGPTELYRRFGIRKQLLDDLYVRFFRLAEIRIGEEAEYGVVSWISNSSYLVGRSHPLMRESLLKSFDKIWIDNLNGDKYRTGKVIPQGLPGEGTSDQSVFTTSQDPRGIQVGTAISTVLKSKPGKERTNPARVWYRDFWGMSRAKRHALLESLRLEELTPEYREELATRPEGPREYRSAEPSEKGRWKLIPVVATGGYEDWPALDELFPASAQGVNPNRGLEGSVIATARSELKKRMADYFSDAPDEEIESAYPELMRTRARYEPRSIRKLLRKTGYRDEQIVPYSIFPMDLRFLYYETAAKLLNERRPELWDNLPGNYFLIAVPHARRRSETKPLIASCLFDLHLHDRGSVGFPVHVRPASPPEDLFADQTSGNQEPAPNLHEAVWATLRKEWKLEGALDGDAAIRTVRDLFHLCLAVGHSAQYQLDHKDALAHDWLHLPIPKDHHVLEEIAQLGARVETLLDPMTDATRVLNAILGSDRRTLAVPSRREGILQEKDLEVTISYYGAARGGWQPRAPRENEAFRDAWGESTGDLHLNEKAYLANVPEKVWAHELGGYPVLKKWLGYRDQKRRPGRPLSHEELDHLRDMVHRLAALLLLQDDLDRAYERALEDPFTVDDLGL